MLPLLFLAACTYEPEHPGLQPQLFAEQDGQDIVLNIRIYEGGDPAFDSRYDLVHMEAGGERHLLRREGFDPEHADEQSASCIDCAFDDTGMSGDPCEEDADAREGCVIWYGFEVTDPCRPAGEISYELRLAGEEQAITVERFYVVDMGGAPCDGSGCSSLPRRGGLAWLGLLGLAALARRRR